MTKEMFSTTARAFATALLISVLVAAAQGHEGPATLPVPIDAPLPECPASMRASGVAAQVEILVLVTAKGGVESAIAVGSTDKSFEAPATEAVSRWRFGPAKIAGIPHKYWCVVKFMFRDGFVSASPVMEEPVWDAPPKLLKSVRPIYPLSLAQSMTRGTAVVQFVVDRDGNVRSPKVVEATHPALEGPAVESVVQWKFAPPTVNGIPIAVRVLQLIRFDMQDGNTIDAFNTVGPASAEGVEPSTPQKLPQARFTAFVVHPYEDAIEGTIGAAEVRFLVNEEGDVVSTRVLRATDAKYGLALSAALETWRFDAVLKDGEPSQAIMRQLILFRPRDRNSAIDEETAALAERIRKNKFKPVDASRLESEQEPIYAPEPVYPTAIRDRGMAGSATIEVIIDKKGRAVLPRIVEASEPEFGWAAATAAQRWRFTPPKVGGKPVEVRMTIPFNFTPQDPETPAEFGGPAG